MYVGESPPALEQCWICNACNHRNFASEGKCQRCELSKADNERVLPPEKRRGKVITIAGREVYARNNFGEPLRKRATRPPPKKKGPKVEVDPTEDLIRELLEHSERTDREKQSRGRRYRRRSRSGSYGNLSGWSPSTNKKQISPSDTRLRGDSDEHKRRSRSYSDKRKNQARSRKRRKLSLSPSEGRSRSRGRRKRSLSRSLSRSNSMSSSPHTRRKRKRRDSKSPDDSRSHVKREGSSSSSLHRKRKRRRRNSSRRKRDYDSSSSESSRRSRSRRSRGRRRRRRGYSRSSSSSRGRGRRKRRQKSSMDRLYEKLKGRNRKEEKAERDAGSDSSDYGPFIRPNLAPTGVAASKMMFGRNEVKRMNGTVEEKMERKIVFKMSDLKPSGVQPMVQPRVMQPQATQSMAHIAPQTMNPMVQEFQVMQPAIQLAAQADPATQMPQSWGSENNNISHSWGVQHLASATTIENNAPQIVAEETLKSMIAKQIESSLNAPLPSNDSSDMDMNSSSEDDRN